MTKLIVITGQSNATGSNNGGPNPSSANVKVWDSSTSDWGSSDYTQNPMLASATRGNSGNNNYALALAHRIHDETAEDVYMVMYASGGKSISYWDTANGGTYLTALNSKVSDALASPELSGLTPDDVIVIWAQGEEDATMAYGDYYAAFGRVVTEMRSTAWCDAYTPILIMEPAPNYRVNSPAIAKYRYAQDVDQFCKFVSTGGFATSDGVHFTGQSLFDIGYYVAYEAYLSTPVSQPSRSQYLFGDSVSLNGLNTPRVSTVTASSDEIIVSKAYTAILGEGGVADTVSKITKAGGGSWVTGDHIWLRAASSGQVITLSEVAGGNIKLTSSVVLNSNRKVAHLLYDSGVGGFITEINT